MHIKFNKFFIIGKLYYFLIFYLNFILFFLINFFLLNKIILHFKLQNTSIFLKKR